MEAQPKHRQRSSPPEVASALRDLARLSYHVGDTVSEDASHTVTMALLERLLTLCQAQRGALLLMKENPSEPGHGFASSLSGRTVIRTFSLQGMSETEALARGGAYSLKGPDVQSPSGEPCWMIWRLPISSPSEIDGHQQNNTGEFPVTNTGNKALLPIYALLVLGWTSKDGSDCLSATAKSRLTFPLVADVAGMVIANLLLAERAHELETSTNRQALREMELLKAELLATVSHELRSPLSSIKGYAATLLRHEHRIAREERREFLLAINEASDRLEIVIDRLLEMSLLDTGTIVLDPTPVNLVHLVHEAITALEERVELVVSADFQHQEQQKDIAVAHPYPGQERTTITVRLEDLHGVFTDEEPVIWADRHRLREVLDNLLQNALIYSTEGGAIEVIVRPVVAASTISKTRTTVGDDVRNGKEPAPMLTLPEHQQMIEVCVRDHGIGIPREHLERIFDRFHRVDTRLTREVNGLGLGLTICKRIVELHKGVIWAESEPGNGSAFHVWLPLEL